MRQLSHLDIGNQKMKLKFLVGAALVAGIFSAGAHAATITNNEPSAQTFKIYAGERQQDFTLQPSDTVMIDEGLCPESCVLALSNGDEFEFAYNEDLILEQGAVFVNPPSEGGSGEQTEQQQQQ